MENTKIKEEKIKTSVLQTQDCTHKNFKIIYPQTIRINN